MPKRHRFFRLLIRLRVPEPIYYWLLDRLTDNGGWRPLSYRERRYEPMPSRFEALARYNSEVSRGLLHQPEHAEHMAALQREFNQWRADA